MEFSQPYEFALIFNLSKLTTLESIDAVLLGQLALRNYMRTLSNFGYSDVVINIIGKFKIQVNDFVYNTLKELLQLYKQLIERPIAASKRLESLAKRAQAKKLSSIFYTQS
jgi:hypothetical protein